MPESTVATNELVVPKSMPTILLMMVHWSRDRDEASGKSGANSSRRALSQKSAERIIRLRCVLVLLTAILKAEATGVQRVIGQNQASSLFRAQPILD